MRKLITSFFVATLGLLASSAGHAQPYPSKPVRLVVPYAAGGITDIIARSFAQALGKQLSQQVIVDNRPGASGLIGHELVARSAPDGYTLLLATGGSMTINIQMVEKPRFDPLKDFTPISLITVNDAVLLVNNNFPAQTFAEFVDVVKKNPNKYSFASAGSGLPTHLGGELLKQTFGLDLVHIPYKGDDPALVDPMGGSVPVMVAAYGSAASQIKGGTVRALATMGKTRVAGSSIPTVAELGNPGFNAMTWGGIVGPAGLAPEVVSRLSSATRAAMNDPELKAKYAEIGSNIAYSTPAELQAFIKDETVKWGVIIRKLGLKSGD